MSETVQYEDILKVEKPKLVSISFDGTKIAFVVQRADFDKNSDYDTLYYWDNASVDSRQLLTLSKIKEIKWVEDFFYVLGEDKSKHLILSIQTRGNFDAI